MSLLISMESTYSARWLLHYSKVWLSGGRDLWRFCDSWKAKVVVELRSSIGAANKGSIRLNRVNWDKLAKLNKLISSALIESNQLKLQIIESEPSLNASQ